MWERWKALVPSAALLVALCVAFHLPGVCALPPLDRDEPRFAQATRQMLQSGDWVRPRFQGEPLYEKPIGIYWLQAVAVRTVGHADAIWPYRLPSMAAAMLAVLGTLVIGARWVDRESGLLGAAMLAASPVLVVEADLATTDAVLLCCVVIAQSCLGEIFFRRSAASAPWLAVGFWTALAIGALVKGPVAPAVALLTVAALKVSGETLRIRDLRPGWGLLIFLAVVAPWAVAVGIATDWTFYREAFHNDILPKLVGGQESHGAPPGYYLLSSMATFWPASMVALPSVWAAVRQREDPVIRFLLAWLAPTWLLFELMPTKLPHYVLPTFPALALLCARFARGEDVLRGRASRLAVWLWLGVGLAVVAALSVAAFAAHGESRLGAIVTTLVTLTTVVVGVRQHGANDRVASAWVATIGSGVTLALALGVVLPSIESLWPTVRAARAVAERSATRPHPLAIVGYREPSLIFLLGGDVARLDADEAAWFVADKPNALVWIEDGERRRFETAAHEAGVAVDVVAAVEGVNISKGRWVRLLLFAPVDGTQTAALSSSVTERERSDRAGMRKR
jgi:4-amino-4-deoxy-L-arabinose transferase-like glycosyltransferase